MRNIPRTKIVLGNSQHYKRVQRSYRSSVSMGSSNEKDVSLEFLLELLWEERERRKEAEVELKHCKYRLEEMYTAQRKEMRKRYTHQFGVPGNVVCYGDDDIIDSLLPPDLDVLDTSK